ncbi:MAG: hypothetical protein GX190_04760 [Mollicutes bacterium]|nr:hypothetical protein [Mollicutes bacterium]
MKININDVITLTDNRKFLVLAETLFNETKYYYLIELTEDGEQIVDHVKIVKELKEDNGMKLVVVSDPNEINDVKDDLVASLDKNNFE